MRISLNQVKKYVKVPVKIDDQQLIELIGSRLVEIEEVIDLAPKYRGIYVVKVVKAEPIEGTHLNLCEIDAGEHNQDFEQLENGLVQVVCGAPNVHTGMLAIWIAPGAIVPETYGNEDFKISSRKLRGYISHGMLAGADELDLDTEHKNIAEINPQDAQPGDSFADAFDLNDLILDVENKSLTHRPDCFGLIGFAREVAGILGIKFQEPEVFQNIGVKLKNSGKLAPQIEIVDAELCPRYTCAVFDLVDNQPSKYLTREAIFLAKAGMRAIDPMVDLTNIIMLETGQPLHAFDYDKLVQVAQTTAKSDDGKIKIVVRAAHENEELQLLDGKTIQCQDFDILITANGAPVALAGAMGGKNTEIDASTKRVILESATFSLYHLRKTQMAHGIFSEAITRFTKGQPAALCGSVLETALQRLNLEPLATSDNWPHPAPPTVVKITTSEINQLLGTNYDTKNIITTLENVGFEVEELAVAMDAVQDETITSVLLEVAVPAWRTDIHIKEDIIEEVGRLLGYDDIPLSLPLRPFLEASVDPMVALKSELRSILSDRLSMYELLTYSFVSRKLLERVGEDPEHSYRIVNSISPELQCFRQQIAPSLLDKIRENLKAGHNNFTLYELNQVSVKSRGLDVEKVPIIENHLGVVTLGDYYSLKAKLLAMFHSLGLRLKYSQLSAKTSELYPYLEPKRSVEVFINDKLVGSFGEIKTSVLKKFKLDLVVSGAEFNLEDIVFAPRVEHAEVKVSRFPFVERDLTLKVASDVAYWRAIEMINHVLSSQQLIYEVQPTSIYQSKDDHATKNLSFHLKFSSTDKTLDSAGISAIMEKITVAAAQIGATIV